MGVEKPIAEPKLFKGTVITKGNVPKGSVAHRAAAEIAKSTGSAVVVTDAKASKHDKEEGLPTTIEPDPVIQSEN
jgi:hypothetical protein